jgi:Zn finger protein HypA/HybF involved in hydrogenase expression
MAIDTNDSDEQIVKYKTPCCNAKWIRQSRANFRCKKCNKDVTLEVILVYQALIQ